MPQVEYSILGALSVRRIADDAPIVLSEKLGLLLARLLIEPGTVVPATTLAHDVWDEEVELRDPVNSVQRLVSQLRQRLGDTEEPRRVLVSVGGAYRIDADPLTIDAQRFRLLARRGRALLKRHPRAACAMLEEALASWTGPLLGDHGQLRWVSAFAAELEALRDSAEVDLNEALLALGEYERLEGPLRRQRVAHATDERRHAQLIRALEGMSRGTEAVLAYRDAVQTLGSPGTELRRLGERIGRRLPSEPPHSSRPAVRLEARPGSVLLHAVLENRPRRVGERALGTAALIIDRNEGEPYPLEGGVAGAFEDPGACSRAARALTRDPRLRCAVGIHSGGLVQLGDRLLGPGPARCRLLAHAAQPGQTLVTSEAARRDWSPARLRNLGEQRYEDLLRGEPVFELSDPDGASFPPPDTLNRYPHNLPVQQSRFVGRSRELTTISRSVAEGEFVTLVGAGGCGKTRLALQVAAHSLTSFEDGAWFAELAELPGGSGAEAVALAIVARLGARALSEEPARETLVRHLSDRSALLIVDNCEHVADGCAELLSTLRAECERVCVLATSRKPLRVEGERVVDVPAMEVEAGSRVDELPDAVELLLERTGSLSEAATQDAEVLEDARRICAALDGSPLGIELAAGHVATRGLPGVAVEVKAMVSGKRDLDLFSSDDPERAPRQRTIEATIRWSHELLTPHEQAVLRRLAVFRGSFGMSEAQLVSAADDLSPTQVADVVGTLVDCSMVAPEAPLGGVARLRLKQAIRAFAFGQLEHSGELDRTRALHASVYSALASRLAPSLFGEGEQAGLELLEADHDNMRAALSYLLDERRSQEALELVSALWWLWFSHGHFEQGCDWVRAALALDERPSRARVRVLRVGSHLEWWRGGYFEAGSYNDALETCARAIGDQWGEAWALMGHGAVLMFSDPEGAIDLFKRSRRWFGELERDWEAGYAQQLVALGHFYAGRDEAARDAYEEAAVIFERLGHGSVLASVRRGLGLMSARCGQRERGRALCREALAFSESIGDRSGGAQALNFLATISRDEHELETAAELNADALARARQVGDLWATCSALDGIAGVAFERGEPELAARLLARSDVLAERAGYQRPPDDRARREAQAHALRSALGARDLERATAEGELMRVPDAVALARAFVRRLF